MKEIHKIAVAGTGYVGLSLAVLLAQNHPVWCVNRHEEKAALINDRKSPFRIRKSRSTWHQKIWI